MNVPVHSVCEEQRNIVDGDVDLMMLSSALGALPRLTELNLCFCETVEKKDWLESYLALDMTVAEKSYEHHVRVVSNAIRSARTRGVSIHAIHLLGFRLPYYHPWQVPDLSALSKSLRELLDHIRILRLNRSESPLELLSHCALNLHRFDMCNLIVEHAALKDFPEANIKSIRSVGFHDVQIIGAKQLETEWPRLSPELLCSMLEVAPSSILCTAADCRCLPFWEKGWRLHLNHKDQPQCSIPPPMKRKFTEI